LLIYESTFLQCMPWDVELYLNTNKKGLYYGCMYTDMHSTVWIGFKACLYHFKCHHVWFRDRNFLFAACPQVSRTLAGDAIARKWQTCLFFAQHVWHQLKMSYLFHRENQGHSSSLELSSYERTEVCMCTFMIQ